MMTFEIALILVLSFLIGRALAIRDNSQKGISHEDTNMGQIESGLASVISAAFHAIAARISAPRKSRPRPIGRVTRLAPKDSVVDVVAVRRDND